MEKYKYIIDKDERGEFSAHVEDENGQEVYTVANYDDYDGASDSGEVWLVEAGYMRHAKDVNGLAEYLQEMDVIGKDDYIIM